MITEDPNSEFYCPEAVAGKTGYLIKAGNTLVTYGEKDGRRLVSVILKGSPRQYFIDGKELLRFGFEDFYNVNIAENETHYVSGETPVTLGGASYEPSELMVEKDSEITLPEGAVFADAEMSLIDMPADHPENAVGLMQYTYNERKIGQAYILLKNASVPVSGDADAETDLDQETDLTMAATDSDAFMDSDGKDKTSPEKEEKTGKKLPVFLILLIVLAAAAGGAGYWIQLSRKREAEEAAARRERRRKRLMEYGEADEFERLLEEKRNRR